MITKEIFRCVKCGYEANADHNAAQNILRRAGLARMACQANLNRGRQQELAEAYNSSSIVV
ncbi:zinc ribbon domain-containing protein [uncultured Succinatimonas sp.]|uniref:zinc ribbon domain-containing protein n=1 Tax=uncultured Succinatimonas sp. TaxID=1262973 RepID=UPI0034D7A44D